MSTSQSADWHKRAGLRFDPYAYLEASSDPYLAEYTVNLDIFRAAWDTEPALIVAPPGGGKTAARVAVSRACWFDMGGVYPFPLPYNAGLTPLTGKPPTREQHFRALLEAGACALLTGLAFRPERLLRATPASIRAIGGILRAGLPGALDYYLAVLRETGNPAGLTPLLERTYALTTPPPASTLDQFCNSLAATDNEHTDTDPERLFFLFVDLVISVLGFSHVLILIDGIDAISEHQDDPIRGLQWATPLLDTLNQWTSNHIIVKLFIPDPMADLFTADHHHQASLLRQSRIVWNEELLIELLRKRILAASDGRYSSLDAISSPALFDVERLIVESIPPLPRAALQVTHDALQRMGNRDQLEQDDLAAAIAWHERRSAHAVWPSLAAKAQRQ